MCRFGVAFSTRLGGAAGTGGRRPHAPRRGFRLRRAMSVDGGNGRIGDIVEVGNEPTIRTTTTTNADSMDNLHMGVAAPLPTSSFRRIAIKRKNVQSHPPAASSSSSSLSSTPVDGLRLLQSLNLSAAANVKPDFSIDNYEQTAVADRLVDLMRSKNTDDGDEGRTSRLVSQARRTCALTEVERSPIIYRRRRDADQTTLPRDRTQVPPRRPTPPPQNLDGVSGVDECRRRTDEDFINSDKTAAHCVDEASGEDLDDDFDDDDDDDSDYWDIEYVNPVSVE